MTVCRFLLLVCIVGIVSACSSLPHCYSTSAAEASRYETKACPAWMCDAPSGDSVCVTRTGDSDARQISYSLPVASTPAELVPAESDPPVEESVLEPERESISPTTQPISQETIAASLVDAPEGTFVLQLIALSSEAQAEKFVLDRQLDDAQVVAVDSNGVEMHAVVIGYFNTREEGMDAAAAYTASHGGTVWVRRSEELREAVDRLNNYQ